MVETTSPSTALSTATPKRKRDEMIAGTRLSASPTPHHVAKTVFSFQPPNLQPTIRSDNPTEDGNSSPQSRVARKFRDLAIEESGEDREGREGTTSGGEPESGGGATAAAGTLRWRSGSGHERLVAPDLPRFDFDAGAATAQVDMQLDSDDEDTTTGRKRPKTFELDISSPEPTTNTLPGETNDFTIQTLPGCDPETHHLSASASVDSRIASAFEVGKSGKLQKSYPSINRLADSKSRYRKRTGTPPLSSRRKGSAQSQSARQNEEKEESVVVDPVRAALTWREDEITVYDPEDKDDDGTGINGIGFKPTPAVAYQRAQKRRQQLSEYKKREEREARARRTQRRAGAGAEMTRKHSIVRVHFSDAPPTTLMTT